MAGLKMVLEEMHLFFVFFTLHVLWPCKSQDVFFGLKDKNGADQAILSLGTSVTITCNVSCVSRASIRLMFKNNVIEPTSSGGSFVDLTFSVINEAKDPYKCSLNYTTLEFEEVFKEVYFHLPVISNKEIPFCRRSGIALVPYQVGDILSLQCFCYLPQIGTCEWLQATNTTTKIKSTSAISTNGLVNFVYATVGPLTNADTVGVFVCKATNTGGTMTSKTCVIGRMPSSGNDKVYSPNVQSTECKQDSTITMVELTSTMSYHTIQNRKTVLTLNSHSETDAPVQPNIFSFEIILLASIVTFILVMSIIVIICVVVLVKRNKRDNKNKVKKSTKKVNQPSMEQQAGETTGTNDVTYDDVPPLTNAEAIFPVVRSKYDFAGVDTFKVVEDEPSCNRASRYTAVKRKEAETDVSYLYATVDKKRNK